MRESVVAVPFLQPPPQADSQDDEAPPSSRDIGSTPRRPAPLEQAASQGTLITPRGGEASDPRDARTVAAQQAVVDAGGNDAGGADLADAGDVIDELDSVRLLRCTHVALDGIDIILAGGTK